MRTKQGELMLRHTKCHVCDKDLISGDNIIYVHIDRFIHKGNCFDLYHTKNLNLKMALMELGDIRKCKIYKTTTIEDKITDSLLKNIDNIDNKIKSLFLFKSKFVLFNESFNFAGEKFSGFDFAENEKELVRILDQWIAELENEGWDVFDVLERTTIFKDSVPCEWKNLFSIKTKPAKFEIKMKDDK
jgi:hypothetical protein